MAIRKLSFFLLLLVLGQCSPAPKKIEARYVFDEKSGFYTQCQFDGTIDGQDVYDMDPQPYLWVGGHGFEKKINGLWYPNVYQWRGKNGRTITFVVRDGTGGVGQWGYLSGTLNGERAGGFTIVPRYHWVFNTWDGGADLECRQPGGDD